MSVSRGVWVVVCSSYLLFSGCGQPPELVRGTYPIPVGAAVTQADPGQYGGIFIYNETTQPTTLNPLVPNNLTTSMLLSRLLSSLVEYDPRSEQFVPALAESWEVSPNHLSYTFRLREGLCWSDGTPLTADDVVFTFDCILAEETLEETGAVVPRYPSRYYQQFHINGEKLRYEKLDARTVRFDLPDIYAPFIFDIDQPILPKHKLEASFDDGSFLKQWSTQTAIEKPEEIVCSGPFVIHSYRPGERLVLSPNAHFWKVDSEGQRLPYLDYFVYRFVSDSNTAIAHFATGKSDASGVGADDYEWVREAVETYDFKIHERGPSSSVNFFWFNQNRGSDDDGNPYVPPHKLRWFTDKRFRQAILCGLNRQGLIDALLFGKGEPLTSIIPPAQGRWHNPDLPRYDYDPERARALLRASGFVQDASGQLHDSEGIAVRFELLLVEGPYYDKVGVTLVENMKDLGMEVTIQRSDFATLQRRTDSTFDYDMTIMGWASFSAAYDPSGSKSLYLSSGKHHQWYPEQKEPATKWEARIDELIGLQERTLDAEERYQYMHEIQSILAEELPLLYGFSPYVYVGIKDKWRNVFIPKAGSALWNIEELWLEPRGSN
ncbi:MAG: ABC transporter substrate-binding protein [Coraliomargaritaceae bacterium]